jgi:hypothetical protein
MTLNLLGQDLFICPRCPSPVRPEVGRWRCNWRALPVRRRAVPDRLRCTALVCFEHSVLDADRLRAVQGASELHRSRY